MNRISTSNSNLLFVQQMMDLQGRIAKGQTQLATGEKTTTYDGLDTNTINSVLDWQRQASRIQAYQTENTAADVTLQMQENAVQNVENMVSDFRDILLSFSANELSNLPLSEEAQQQLSDLQATAFDTMKSMAAELDVSSGGHYLFSGSRDDTQPVEFNFTSLADFQANYYVTATAPATAQPYPTTESDDMTPGAVGSYHTPYYQGDQIAAQQDISDSKTITLGITARDPAFEKAFRAMGMVAQNLLSTPQDATQLQSNIQGALTICNDALTHDPANTAEGSSDLNALVHQIELNRKHISDQKTEDQSTLSYLQGKIDDSLAADKTAVAVQVNSDLTTLQSSYSLLSSIQKLSLVDYLSG